MKKVVNFFLTSTIISLLLVLNLGLSHAAGFPDVEEDAWFYPYVTELANDGIIEGYPDGRFGSWDPINRAELSKIIVNLKRELENNWIEQNYLSLIVIFGTFIGWAYMISATKKLSQQPIVVNSTCPHCNENSVHPPQKERMYQKPETKKHKGEQNKSPLNEIEQSFEKNNKSNWWV